MINTSSEPGSKLRRRIVRILIVILASTAILLGAYWYSLQPSPNNNRLALGPLAPSAVQDPLDIYLQAPAELDGATRAGVYSLRKAAANRQPQLLAVPYEPSWVVFYQIEGNIPWWGMRGEFYDGPGQQSINGPSEESRFILNPYLLVAAEFYGLSIWGEDNFWDTQRITAQDLDRPDFPFTCQPQDLRWWPHASRAEVTYDVTGCLARLNRWTKRPHTLANAVVSLTAYNARDLNLNYIQLVQSDSDHLQLSVPFDTPIAEPEFIHRGGSCKYPGGCNNASPDVPQFDNITLSALPARLTVHLWKDQPLSPRQPPDMTFNLQFK